jgi:hypothetical protein
MKKIGNWGLRWARLLLVISSLCINGMGHAASVSVTATVDAGGNPPTVAAGDNVILTVAVSSDTSINDVDDVQLPSLDGFSLVGQSGKRSQTTIINGQFRTSISFDYQLIAERPGTFRLGSISVVVDGEPKRTEPITIKVLPAGSQAPRGRQQQPNPADMLDEDDPDQMFADLMQRYGMGSGGFQAQPVNPKEAYHVLVEVDKTKAFVGEQITASWYLATRGILREFDPLKYPQLRGFWKEDIEIATSLNFRQEVINGMPYKKALLMRSALFPIKEGNAVIDPYKTKATVILGGGAFGGLGLGQPYVFNKASQEVKVEILPLPTQGRPADFTGAVGQFQMTSAVNTSQIVANQPFEYRLRIQGLGNAKSIELPPLNLPPSLELYDQKTDSKFNPDGTSYKDFTLYIIPRQAGEVTVPAISMSYFDVKSKSYVRKSAPELKIQVRDGGPGAPAPSTDSQTKAAPSDGAQKGAKVLRPKFELALELQTPSSPLKGWPLWLITYVLVGVALAASAYQMGFWGATDAQKEIRRQLNLRLTNLRQSAKKGDWRQVGAQGTNLIYFVLGELSEQKGAREQLEKMLEKVPPSLRGEFQGELQKLLEQLEILTFAPETFSASAREPRNLQTLTADLEKCLTRALKIYSGDATASKSSPTTNAQPTSS